MSDPLADLAQAAEAFRHRSTHPRGPYVLPPNVFDALMAAEPDKTAAAVERGEIISGRTVAQNWRDTRKG